MPETSSNPADQTPERRAANSLPSAVLLAFTGGALDAFVYLNHGHVFAAAQTGNGVLFGVAMLHADFAQAMRHVLPILAFMTGVLLAKLLDKNLKDHAVVIGLLSEITVLFALSWLPGGFPDEIFVPLIAIVAAYQVAGFRKADTYAYNSTFMTGNLRTTVDGLFEALSADSKSDDRAKGLRKARELALIVGCFMSGAVAGAIFAPKLYNHTLWFIDVPLIVVLLLVLRRTELR
jgi:uncharacterized membrane protein YoaK (UPF0700 family)